MIPYKNFKSMNIAALSSASHITHKTSNISLRESLGTACLVGLESKTVLEAAIILSYFSKTFVLSTGLCVNSPSVWLLII